MSTKKHEHERHHEKPEHTHDPVHIDEPLDDDGDSGGSDPVPEGPPGHPEPDADDQTTP